MMTARVRWADVTEGEELKPWSYAVRREDLVRYAKASGDGNPIHQDESFAKSVGLPDVIAHGMHTMAKMGQFVTDWAGDPGAVKRFWTRFSVIVVVPADTGNRVVVSGKVGKKLDGNRVLVEVKAEAVGASAGPAAGEVQAGTLVAKAEAEVELA